MLGVDATAEVWPNDLDRQTELLGQSLAELGVAELPDFDACYVEASHRLHTWRI